MFWVKISIFEIFFCQSPIRAHTTLPDYHVSVSQLFKGVIKMYYYLAAAVNLLLYAAVVYSGQWMYHVDNENASDFANYASVNYGKLFKILSRPTLSHNFSGMSRVIVLCKR